MKMTKLPCQQKEKVLLLSNASAYLDVQAAIRRSFFGKQGKVRLTKECLIAGYVIKVQLKIPKG